MLTSLPGWTHFRSKSECHVTAFLCQWSESRRIILGWLNQYFTDHLLHSRCYIHWIALTFMTMYESPSWNLPCLPGASFTGLKSCKIQMFYIIMFNRFIVSYNIWVSPRSSISPTPPTVRLLRRIQPYLKLETTIMTQAIHITTSKQQRWVILLTLKVF